MEIRMNKETYLKRRRTNIILVSVMIILSFTLGCLSISIYDDIKDTQDTEYILIPNETIYTAPTSSQDVIDFCANKSLMNTSICLNGMFETIYNYSPALPPVFPLQRKRKPIATWPLLRFQRRSPGSATQ